MKFTFIIPDILEQEFRKLDQNVLVSFEKKLLLLQENPRHPSLRTHPVGKTPSGETIWSSSINMSYRSTWQYGPANTQITLRHIDCHKVYRHP